MRWKHWFLQIKDVALRSSELLIMKMAMMMMMMMMSIQAFEYVDRHIQMQMQM